MGAETTNRNVLVLVLFLAGAVALGGVTWKLAGQDDEPSALDRLAASHVINYCWSGPGTVSVTLRNGEGNTEQLTGRRNGSCSGGMLMEPGAFAYVSVQLEGSGTVGCRIESDGEVIESARSDGAYVIAQCSGRVP